MKLNGGYVYVLINPSHKGLVKVGKTMRSTEERAAELSAATGVPTPFTVAYEQFFDDCHAAERYVHACLEQQGFRLSPNREFFNAPLKDVVSAVVEAASIFGTEATAFSGEGGGDFSANHDHEITHAISNEDIADERQTEEAHPATDLMNMAATATQLGMYRHAFVQCADQICMSALRPSRSDDGSKLIENAKAIQASFSEVLQEMIDTSERLDPLENLAEKCIEDYERFIRHETDDDVALAAEVFRSISASMDTDVEHRDDNERVLWIISSAIASGAAALAVYRTMVEKRARHAFPRLVIYLEAEDGVLRETEEYVRSMCTKFDRIVQQLKPWMREVRATVKCKLMEGSAAYHEELTTFRSIFSAYVQCCRQHANVIEVAKLSCDLEACEVDTEDSANQAAPVEALLEKGEASRYGSATMGIYQDIDEAVRLYKMAGEMRSVEALIALGDIYRLEEACGGPKAAIQYYQKANDLGHRLGLLYTADCYYRLRDTHNALIAIQRYRQAVGKAENLPAESARELYEFIRSEADDKQFFLASFQEYHNDLLAQYERGDPVEVFLGYDERQWLIEAESNMEDLLDLAFEGE